jgi:hypothetical protein
MVRGPDMRAMWIRAGILAVLLGTTGLKAADRAPYAWLLGAWTGEGGGAEQGAGGFSFTPEAGGQVIVRRNVADYPGQNGKPASRHEDFMVIEGEGAAVTARYWDSEGQTLHYALTAPQPGVAVFLSDDPAGPRFRLTYTRTAAGLNGSFEIAPPDHRDQFRPYLTWTAKKAR